ncbi:MAG: hypothetical protein KA140_04300 [Caldisericia bacterium]|nr:hypothetical protein [Caldisericia bacterium]
MIIGSIKIKHSGTIKTIGLSECIVCADNIGRGEHISSENYNEYLIDTGFFYILYIEDRNTKKIVDLIDLRDDPKMFREDVYLATGIKGYNKAKEMFNKLPNKHVANF